MVLGLNLTLLPLYIIGFIPYLFRIVFLPEQMRLRNSFALEGHATIATLLRMIPSLKSLKNLDGGLFLYMSFRSTDIDSTRSSQSSRGQIGPLSDDMFEMWVMTLSQL